MNFLSPLRYVLKPTILLLMAVMIFSACSDDSGTGPGQQTAKIQGRVTNDSGFNYKLSKLFDLVEGATVTVVEIQADGSFETVSNGSVETDVSGEFLVETNVDGVSGLIVVAQKNNVEWMAVVSSEVKTGSTSRCQPLNDESTTESEIERNERPKRTDSSSDAMYADIAAFVNVDVAANIKGNVSAMTELTTAIEAAAEAHAQTLTHASLGVTQSQLEAANSARAKAQIDLEVALYNAEGDQSGIDSAFESNFNTVVNAYVDANIALESHAKAKTVSSKVLVKNSTNLSTNAQLAVEKAAGEIRAQVISRACEAQFAALGAESAQVDAVANAGVTLRLSIKSANSDSEIVTAFDAYHETIINKLQASSNNHATAIVAMDVAINEVGGAKLVLNVNVSTASTTEAVVDAYINFYNAIRTLVETTLTTATETEINATTEILILSNMTV